MELWTLVDRNRNHEKFAGYKLLIADRNWNDNGYYTLYSVVYQQPKDFLNRFVGEIKIFNPNKGEDYRASITNSHDSHDSYVTFICNKTCAMALFLVLTPEERKEMIESLHIKFDCSEYKLLEVFKKSVLRDTTLEKFVVDQREIEKLMLSDINPAHYISSTEENHIKDVLSDFSEVIVK